MWAFCELNWAAGSAVDRYVKVDQAVFAHLAGRQITDPIVNASQALLRESISGLQNAALGLTMRSQGSLF